MTQKAKQGGRQPLSPGRVRLGVCSWADKTMVEAWYPPHVKTAAARLDYYSRIFDTVEVDSSFYGMPSERNAALWAERTPPGFVFHVKAFAMMTRHEVRPKQLPASLATAFDSLELDRRGRILHPPQELRETVFEWFSSALEPLRAAGKLGVILLQFPPYFVANDRNRAYLRWAVERLTDRVAVEFRHNSWVSPDELGGTLDLLTALDASYVGVDVPRLDSPSTLPPITAATSDIGYLRFSGRNKETWHKKVESAALRFRYLYKEEELREWVEPVRDLAERTQTTYVMFNNCYRDYAPRNAGQMAALLGLEFPAQDRSPSGG